jgi:hypothetical protein
MDVIPISFLKGRTMRRIRILIIVTILLQFGYVRAQKSVIPPIKGHNNCVWTERGNFIIFPDGMDPIKKPGVAFDQNGKKRVIPKSPSLPALVGADASTTRLQGPCGRIYALSRRTIPPADPLRIPKKDLEIYIFRFDESIWQWETDPIGVLRSPLPFSPILLSEDNILGISHNSEVFISENHRYPLAIFRKNAKNEYQVDHFEDYGFDYPAIQRVGVWNYPCLENFSLLHQDGWSGEFTIIGHGGGLFWCFDSRGKLKRFFKIYKNIEDEFYKKNPIYNECILGWKPQKSGTILVSAFGEDLFYRSSAQLQKPEEPSPDIDSYRIKIKIRSDTIFSVPQSINWYNVDIENGQVQETSSPINIPRIISSFQEFLEFNWMLKYDESIDFISLHHRFSEPTISLPLSELNKQELPSISPVDDMELGKKSVKPTQKQ